MFPELPITKEYCWDVQLQCWWKVFNCTPHPTTTYRIRMRSKRYIDQFIKMLCEEFKKRSGFTPYAIINEANVNLLNLNMGIIHATFGHPLKVELYCQFECLIQNTIKHLDYSTGLAVVLGEVCILMKSILNKSGICVSADLRQSWAN